MTALDLEFIDGQCADRIMLIMTLSSSIQGLISSQMTDLRHYWEEGRGACYEFVKTGKINICWYQSGNNGANSPVSVNWCNRRNHRHCPVITSSITPDFRKHISAKNLFRLANINALGNAILSKNTSALKNSKDKMRMTCPEICPAHLFHYCVFGFTGNALIQVQESISSSLQLLHHFVSAPLEPNIISDDQQ